MTHEIQDPVTSGPRRHRRVVVFGGGTGMPSVLRGLRELRLRDELDEITAVVTMTDDGGSSGRLRRSRGLPPPGDLRNCLVALAKEEDLMARLFQHRYSGAEELGGHTVGNLIIAALAEQTGSFLEAVELSSRVLRVAGRILPATSSSVSLSALMHDDSRVQGETNIATSGKRIRQVSLQPSPARPTPGVLEAIERADIIALGPGSLFTSVIPNLLVEGVVPALRRTRAVIVFVANLVTEPGETNHMDLAAHLRAIEEHAGDPVVDAVLAHEGPIESVTLARYEAEGSRPLRWSADLASDVVLLRRNLAARCNKLRHDPAATATALLDVWSSGDCRTRRRLALSAEGAKANSAS